MPPKLTPMTQILTDVTPKCIGILADPRQVSVPEMSVLSCFKLIALKVMLQKPNLTSVTLKLKVTTPKRIGFLGGLWGRCIPGFKLTDRQTDSSIT